MGLRSKKEAFASIVQRNQKGRYAIFEAYLGTDPESGKVVRKYAKTRQELEKDIRDFYLTLSRCGEAGASLSRKQAIDAKRAYEILAEARQDVSLAEVAIAYINGKGMMSQVQSISIGEAFSRYMATVQDKSDAYKKDIRIRVGKWMLAFGENRPISEVTAPEVKKYLVDTIYQQGKIETWVTYNNHLGNIKTFMAWCADMEQGMLAQDPIAGMKKLTIPYRQPQYMKANDVRKLFSVLWERRNTETGKSDLAYCVMSFFCGMRLSEIDRFRLGDDAIRINLEEQTLRVCIPKGISKGIKPRAFTIPQQAMTWIKAFDFMDGIMKPNTHLRERLAQIAKDHGFKLPKNAGRHTFITMFEAVHHDQNALTAIVGNTDDVRQRNYNGVEFKAEGEAYFRILPSGAAA